MNDSPSPNARNPLPVTETRVPGVVGWFFTLMLATFVVSTVNLERGAGLLPVDAWVAQTAREMYESPDWRGYFIPRFSGETRMQKSPGAYWAVCLTAWLRGSEIDEIALRIPNVVAALVFVATVFWLARSIAGDRAAVFAGFAAASCGILLYWCNRGASDLGVSTLCALSLTCLWIGAERTDGGWRRTWLWLAAYFIAGLAMLYKMPMPLVCIGLPAAAYVVVRRRWSLLADWRHVVGLVLFLLPWLPWALVVMQIEPAAIHKWKVEYVDRMTGELPNVEEQKQWYFYLFYIAVAFAFVVPYSASLPIAIARPFRAFPAASRDGRTFLLTWIIALFAFFTLSTGKETRYFLPVVPPLLVLLGAELAAFFDPNRTPNRKLDLAATTAVALGIPAGFIYGGFQLHKWHALSAADIVPWPVLLTAIIAVGAIFWAGALLSALLYYWRREHAAFGALVVTSFAAWVAASARLTPILASQAPLKDFAEQLRELSPEHRAVLRQVAQQDPRIIWHSDVRFPRVIDQLQLLEIQGGKRHKEDEVRLIGEAIIRRLEAPDLALFVAASLDYGAFILLAPEETARAGHPMPPVHLWLRSRVGRMDQWFVLFGNQPPPWPEPTIEWPERMRSKLHEAAERTRARLSAASRPASAGRPSP